MVLKIHHKSLPHSTCDVSSCAVTGSRPFLLSPRKNKKKVSTALTNSNHSTLASSRCQSISYPSLWCQSISSLSPTTVNRYVIIAGYVCVWALLVRFYAIINHENKIGIYHSIKFLLFADMFKIFVSLVLLTRRQGYKEFVKSFRSSKNQKIVLYYIPIACLYAMNNTGNQVSPQIDDIQYEMESPKSFVIPFIQMACGVTAAVCNEKLLKQDDAKNLHLHNIYLYLMMMVIRVALKISGFNNPEDSGEEISTFSALESFHSSAPVHVFPFLIVLTAADIMNSMMLRYESTTTKIIISTVVLGFISTFHFLIYHFTFVPNKIFAIFLIRMGIVMFCFPVQYIKRIAKSKVEEVQWTSATFSASHLKYFRMCMILSCAFVCVQMPFGRSRDLMINQSLNLNFDRIEGEDRMKNLGMVACISSGDDVAHAIALGRSIDKMNESRDSNIVLELYHYASISHFVTAVLDSYDGVSVIDMKNPVSDFCLVDAMSITKLDDVVLVKTSIILLGALQFNRDHQPLLSRSFCENGARGSNSTGTITSTSLDLDRILDSFSSFYQSNDTSSKSVDFGKCKFHRAFRFEDSLLINEHFDIAVATKSEKYEIGQIHFTDDGVLMSQDYVTGYIYPVRSDFDWITYQLQSQFFCEISESTISMCDDKFLSRIKNSWHEYRDAYDFLLLDRPLTWVTFDGGLVSYLKSQKEETNQWFNSLGGTNILNIDLTVASGQAIPVPQKNNNNHTGSSIDAIKRGRELFNPRLSDDILKKLLQDECIENCTLYTDLAEELMETLILRNDVEIIFSLMSSSGNSQENQAWEIYKIIKEKNDINQSRLLENVAVRLSSSKALISREATPDNTYENVVLGKIPPQLKYYFDAPSILACHRMASWAQEHNLRLAGCFVDQNYFVDLPKSSQAILTADFMSDENLKVICDIQRRQGEDTDMQDEIFDCVEEGFDLIHHPSPLPLEENHNLVSKSALSSILSEGIISESLSATKSKLISSVPSEENGSATIQKWNNPESSWVLASPYDWNERKEMKFTGSAGRLNNNELSDSEINVAFNHISQVLIIMLFLRLQELHFIDINDEINKAPHKVTWIQVFTNTAGIGGRKAGKKFLYDDYSFWSYVPHAIEAATDMSFIDAITFYILDPMGLEGTFDTRIKEAPYFPANGFTGSSKDLLIIGSTLASGGISPKTRKRILLRSSLNKMLEESIMKPSIAKSFHEDKTVQAMTKFQSNKSNQSPGVVEGYGMGLWRVSGWRHQHNQTSPVPGWLSLGKGDTQSILYFDEMGFVLGMISAKDYFDTMFVPSFADVIEELGSQIETAILRNEISV